MNPLKGLCMQTVTMYARRLELLSKGLMFLTPAFFGIKWFHDLLPSIKLDFGIETALLSQMPVTHRLFGLIVDGIAAGILINCLIIFTRLMQSYQAGDIFSSNVFRLLEKLSSYAFFWAVYSVLSTSILSVVTTLHKQPGQRVLSIGFGTNDVMNIFIFGCLCVIASVMREANTLKSENDLTV
jgi:hypothetical protein